MSSTTYKDVVGEAYAGELAYAGGYIKPIRFRVTIKSADETETLHIYDSFAIRGTNNISLQSVSVTQGLDLAGSAFVSINDSRDRVVDPNKLDNGAVIIIEAGKTAEAMQRIFYGIVIDREIARNTDRIYKYDLDCLGFGSILSHTHVNFQRVAPPRDLKATNPALNMEKQYDTTDVKYMAHQIVRDLFTDKLIMPFGGDTVQERGHFTLNNIKTNVIDFIPTLSYPIVVVAEILKTVERMTGTFARIDEDGDVSFMYPSNLISGHVIRGDFDENDLGVGDWTSYPTGEWRFRDSISQSSGFANHLIMKAEKVDFTGGSIRAVGATSTYNKDLAQKLDVTTSLFSNMSLVLYKSGGGTNEDNPAKAYLNGAIVEDVGNTPTGVLVATFRIPLKNIPLSPAPIPKIVMQFRQPVNVSRQHWCILFEKGSGDVLTGEEDNTCYWCHNDDYETINQWSAIRPLQYGRINGDPFSNVGWRVRNKGPKYSHGLAVVNTILCEMKDPRSIRKWTPGRPVEELVPTLTGASVQTAMLMLGHRIKFSARKRRTWNYQRVTIPNRLFRVGSFVRMRDENTPLLRKSMNVYAQIREVAYSASVESDDPRGSCFCNVLPIQYVRPREEIVI